MIPYNFSNQGYTLIPLIALIIFWGYSWDKIFKDEDRHILILHKEHEKGLKGYLPSLGG